MMPSVSGRAPVSGGAASVTPATRWHWTGAPLSTWASLAYLGWMATILGYAMWTGLLKRHPVNRVAPFSLGVPVVGIAAGMLVLGDTINTLQWTGIALIVAALACVLWGGRLLDPNADLQRPARPDCAAVRGRGVVPGRHRRPPRAAQEVIEAIGILAAAVVALQIAETIVEEEVVRDADISAPTRVRRFLSRFFVVVVVALAIEGLVATFRAVHDEAEDLVYVAALIASVGVLLASWGVFVYLNRSAEELEPAAMEEAQAEDHK
eukprot:gene25092-28366_t